jgi:TPR repeat protein
VKSKLAKNADKSAEARKNLRRACENNPTKCINYAEMLAKGRGGPRDTEGAKKALQRGCRLSSLARAAEPACDGLFDLSQDYDLETQDIQETFAEACVNGVDGTCRYLAQSVGDPREASALLGETYRTACERDHLGEHQEPCFRLAVLVERGIVDQPEGMEPAALLRRACSSPEIFERHRDRCSKVLER